MCVAQTQSACLARESLNETKEGTAGFLCVAARLALRGLSGIEPAGVWLRLLDEAVWLAFG